MALTKRQLALLQQTFDELQESSEGWSLQFYEEFFRLDPSLRPLFRGDVVDQGMRFRSTLGFMIEHLAEPADLVERTRDLGEGHRALGVKPQHFVTMSRALIATLKRALAGRFSEEAEEAWIAAFVEISRAMIRQGRITDS